MPRFKGREIANESIKNEFKMLMFLKDLGDIRTSIPNVLDLIRIEESDLLVSEFMEGSMLNEVIDKEDDPDVLSALISGATDILFAMKDPGSTAPLLVDKDFLKVRVEDPARTIAEYYPQHLNALQDSVQNFLSLNGPEGLMLRRSVCHMDFNPWNILLKNDKTYKTLDWEDSVRDSLPMLDLYNFFAVAFRIAMIGESETAQKRPLKESLSKGQVIMDLYDRISAKYKEHFSLSDSAADLLFVIFVLTNTLYFSGRKRSSLRYAEDWLALLFNKSPKDLFLHSLKREAELFAGIKSKGGF